MASAAGEHRRRVRDAPQPRVPVQEVGLKALGPLTTALAKAPPAKSAPILEAVANLLKHVAPLRMFEDFAPAHAPPDAPLIIAAGQVSADSVRGGQYAAAAAFAEDARAGATTGGWCSKSKPSGGKTAVTVTFARPEQLTGVFISLPADDKLMAEKVGLEVLCAPPASAAAGGSGSAAAPALDTPADIAAYVARAPRRAWAHMGVISASAVRGDGMRVPVSAPGALALRICFKGFGRGNADKYHGMAKATVFAASDRIRPGVGGAALYTDSAAVVDTLSRWFRSVGVTASSGAGAAPGAAAAAVDALCGLVLATGSLGAALSLLEVLLAHEGALPAPLAARVRGFLARVEGQFDAVARVAAGGRLAEGSAPLSSVPASGAGGGDWQDVTSSVSWADRSSNVTVDGLRVRSTSSPEYATLSLGISKGRLEWTFTIEEDYANNEQTCWGIARRPVSTPSYETGGNNMWLWRAYNGQLYANGSSSTLKCKFHPGEPVRLELDMDKGELKAWHPTEGPQGVLFASLPPGTYYPCVQWYSSSKSVSIKNVRIYAPGGAANAKPSVFLHSLPRVEDKDKEREPPAVGLGATLGVPFTEADVAAAGGSGSSTSAAPVLGPDGAAVLRPASLHGVPARRSVAVPLPADAGATYRLGWQLGEEPKEKSSSGDKDKKKEKKGPTGPSPYCIFEAVVGLADFVTDASSLPAEAEGAAAAAAAAAEDAAATAAARAARAAAATAAAADEDSKEEGPHMERESKSGSGAGTAAAAAGSGSGSGSGVRESKGASAAGGDDDAAAAGAGSGAAEASVVTFRVVGDGRVLWTSPAPLAVPASGLARGSYAAHARLPAVHCLVDISGVARLELEVVTSGGIGSAAPGGYRAFALWGDARVRAAPWLSRRLAFESEMSSTGPASGLPADVATVASGESSAAAAGVAAGDDAAVDDDAVAASLRAYPLLAVMDNQASRAATAAAAASASAGADAAAAAASAAAAARSRLFRYTQRLQAPDVALTGPAAAAALLRLLRLFAREAAAVTGRAPSGIAELGAASMPLEAPFVLQADGPIFGALAGAVATVAARLRARGGAAASGSLYSECLTALLAVVQANLRRVAASRVLPADLGITLAADDAASSAAAKKKDGSASPAPAPAPSPAHKERGTLAPLLDVLSDLVNSGTATTAGAAAGAGASAVPITVAAAAADAINAGLSLFYPSPAAQAALLSELLGHGEGAVLEVAFPWPARLADTDPAAADAARKVAALAKPPSADADGKDKKDEKDAGSAAGGLELAAAAALTRFLTAGAGAGAAAVGGAGAAAAAGAATAEAVDFRFERAILLLQAYATRRGLPHSTAAHWGQAIHFVMSVPDAPDADAPIARALGPDFAAVLAGAGIDGWSFPAGCAAPEISLKVERFQDFDRHERLAADGGALAPCVRLFPARVATLDGVAAAARTFLEQRVAAERERARAAAAAAAGGEGDGEKGEGEEKDKKEDKGAAAAAADKHVVRLDVFGDPISGDDDDASHHSGSPSPSGSVSGSESGSGSDGEDGEDDDDDDDGEEEEEASGDDDDESGGMGLFD